jgi:glyoxylase-like metal-dependent hydrolase (beta-lactamase superfamily II)
MELFPITDTIFLVPADDQGAFPHSHAVYVKGNRCVLFDGGCGPQVMQAFFKQFKVDVVIASHSHPNHCSSLWMLQGKEIPLFVPKESGDDFGDLAALAQRFVRTPVARNLWAGLATQRGGFRPCPPTHFYDGKSSFDLGSHKLLAVHTPGHTRDHYCFFEELSGVMLGFDVDLSALGPSYYSPESDISSYQASIELVKSYKPSVFVSSHRGVLRKGIPQALERFAAVLDRRDTALLALLEAPLSSQELAAKHLFFPDFPEDLAPLYQEWELTMLEKHLTLLMERGQLGRTVRGWQRI